MRLQNKVVLVTASTRGIGLACVKACAANGARVYMAARNMARAQETADALNGAGAQVSCVYNDADEPESFSAMVDTVAENEGHLDVLINNFGASDPVKDLDFTHTDPSVFLNTVTRNLRSVFLSGQAAARHMAAGQGGSILNISSISSTVADISQVAYGVSKAAINHLTRLIAVQEAKNGIRCNAILPGMTATEAVETRLSDQFRSLFLRHIPLGRMGLPEEIAAAAVYLASDEAAYVTGQLLTVSGGFGLATPVYADLSDQKLRR